VWRTDVYERLRHAEDAIFSLADYFGGDPVAWVEINERTKAVGQ
jgi:hypothetical protein